jgi:Flp pilus assembly pilin Flp
MVLSAKQVIVMVAFIKRLPKDASGATAIDYSVALALRSS